MSHKSFLESNFLKFDLEIYKKNLEHFYKFAPINRKNKKIAEDKQKLKTSSAKKIEKAKEKIQTDYEKKVSNAKQKMKT